MCLITKHAHALKRLTELEAELAQVKADNELAIAELEIEHTLELDELKAQYEPVFPSDYPIFDISWFALVAELKELGIELMLKPEHIPDTFVRYTDEASWTLIVPFLVYPADLYVADIADCDDYARWAAADSSRKFKLNGCLECWGNSQWGYHAYSLVKIAPKEYRIFDSNAGFPEAGRLLRFGEYGYVPKHWRL